MALRDVLRDRDLMTWRTGYIYELKPGDSWFLHNGIRNSFPWTGSEFMLLTPSAGSVLIVPRAGQSSLPFSGADGPSTWAWTYALWPCCQLFELGLNSCSSTRSKPIAHWSSSSIISKLFEPSKNLNYIPRIANDLRAFLYAWLVLSSTCIPSTSPRAFTHSLLF